MNLVLEKLRPVAFVLAGVVLLAGAAYTLWPEGKTETEGASEKTEAESKLPGWENLTPLMRAAAKGEHGTVKRILDEQKNIDLDEKDYVYQRTALDWARKAGRRDIEQMLLDAGATDTGKVDAQLLEAVRLGDFAGLQSAIAAGGNVHARVSFGDDPAIVVATRTGNVDMIQALIQAGADINDFTPMFGTPLMIAINQRRPSLAETLIGLGADVDPEVQWGSDSTPLEAAARMGDEKTMRLLLERGADPKAHDYLAMRAAMVTPEPDAEVIGQLVAYGVPVDVKDKNGRTPLMWAVEAGSEGAVRALISNGANVNAQDKDGNTALHILAGAIDDQTKFQNNYVAEGRWKCLIALLETSVQTDIENNAGLTAEAIADDNPVADSRVAPKLRHASSQ